ncbi:hypothetical protein ACLBXM_21750 [Xanthobacteraceae bacterium A53D]
MTNRLSIQEDRALPPGWVVIRLPAPPQGGAPGVTIQRRGQTDRPHLGPDGWQTAAHLIAPSDMRAGGTEWLFGRDVTGHLALDMALEISVPAAGIVERHFWPEVSHGPAIPPTPAAPVPPAPQPVPEVALASFSAPVEPPAPVVSKPGNVSKAMPRWMLAALCAILVLAGVVGGWFWLRPAAVPTAVSVAGPDFAGRYQQYLQQGGQAEALHALSGEAFAAGVAGVGFDAVTLAADRGSVAARLQMARWYDPTKSDHGPLTPNAGAAATYYQDLAKAGDAAATEGLRALCAAAEAPAAATSDAYATFDRATFCSRR